MNEVFAHAAFGQFYCSDCTPRVINTLAMQAINNRPSLQRHTPFLRRPSWKVAWYACASRPTILGGGNSELTYFVLQEDLTKEIEELRAKSATRKAMAREKEDGAGMCIDTTSAAAPAAVSSTFVA